jgi:hypothetical protein
MKNRQKIGLAVWVATLCALSVQAAPKETAERAARAQIAASTLADAVVVDCQLPGRLMALGGMRNYLTPGVLSRLAAIDCRTRGGEYTVGDLASGTLSLARWLPLAEKGDVEAEYYVARIYANGMDNVAMDYSKAADWYQRAAHKKYAPAMQELGYLYEQGLGVQQDPLAGLNLQREASGLGEDLDYAWKIAATREQADRQIAAFTEQLAGANSVVRDLRAELQVRDARLLQGRAQLATDQQQLAQLRVELKEAQSVSGSGSSSANAARIQELQQKLASDASALTDKQREIDELTASLSTQQAQLAGQLAKSQVTNSKLNELLASGSAATEGLRANTAQMELRLNQAEAELSMLRTSYLQATNELAARSEELQQLREHGGAAAQALLAAKQRELDQQRSRITSLESQLAAASTQGAEAGSSSKQALAHNQELEKSLAALRAQYNQQQQDLQVQRAQTQRLQSQARDDKQSRDEKSPLMAQLSTNLAAKTQELEEQQRRVAAMRAEADRLRDEYARAREASDRQTTTISGQEKQVREALRLAQEKIAKQNNRMEHLEVEVAGRKLELVKLRESLTREAAGNELANRKRIAALEVEVREKDKQLSAVRVEIAKSGEPKAPAPVAVNLNTRGPRDTVGTPDPDELLRMVRRLGPAKYHALVIGNSHYQLMSGLKTPVGDARDVADVLGSHYGFDVKLLTDATRDQIMAAMNEYARTLTDADRLLIYYAGHGGTKIFPPERAFWLGVDADPELPSSWLSAQTVSDAIWQIHARHILLVADSCFSSVITHPTSTTLVRADDEHVTAIRWNKAARMVLTSGQNEPVVDSTSADATHSLFAEIFITVLRRNSILLSGGVLAHELNSRIQEYARRTGLKQTPTYSNLQDPQHKFGDFFFVPLATPVQMASRQ